MKTLLLTLGLSLVAALPAQDPLGLISEKLDLIGTWYVKALVDTKVMPVEQRPKKVSPQTITALEGGDLVITFTIMKKGQCHKMNVLLEKTEEPGKYRAFNGTNLVQGEELPVKDHYAFIMEGQHRGRPFHMGNLIGRNLDVNFEALEEFKKFVQRKGFLQENIFIPAQTGK
ncbi:odorant-binding protein 2b-like [Dasypus novemcinctus]|uniref:odorant-binding protein 2b-like n=1 Tax=Dasypus novemcinctus TaxID=9361 RepID=UPI00265E9A73|nr:odorant-binding protein 2b-like [Dasypus novemcinctus]